jgi:thiamine-phosphate pyrophosphorylase
LRGVYALIDPSAQEPIAATEALLRGGIRLVQIRAKDGIDAATLLAIVGRVRAAGGLTLVNDDVRMARLADGLHLGQEDAAPLDLAQLRRGLPDAIVGLSCGTPAEAREADPRIIDYLGVGPIFGSRSKDDAGPAIGISGVRAVVEATTLPCAAIGGIGLDNLARVAESGAQMAAVLSALTGGDVEAAARALVERWNGARR